MTDVAQDTQAHQTNQTNNEEQQSSEFKNYLL